MLVKGATGQTRIAMQYGVYIYWEKKTLDFTDVYCDMM